MSNLNAMVYIPPKALLGETVCPSPTASTIFRNLL